MSSLNQGTLITWKPDKGFGFIRPQDGSKDVFVHVRDFGNIARSPQVGDEIRYQRIRDRTGRYRAADVQINGLDRKSANRKPSGIAERSAAPAASAGLAVAIALSLLVAYTPLPVVVPLLYLVASLAAFLLYAFDKAAAMNRRQRTRENTLLLVGVAGGWPGALIAQSLFRHKTSKISFQAQFWITVALNCAFLGWACTQRGADLIRAALE